MLKREENYPDVDAIEESLLSRAKDLDSPSAIKDFVDSFYARIRKDPRLSHIFFKVARIDIDKHLPHIRSYWRKLLLSDPEYNRHTMNIHRKLHDKALLRTSDFDRWLALFVETVDDEYSGPKAARAKNIAKNIVANMHSSLGLGNK